MVKNSKIVRIYTQKEIQPNKLNEDFNFEEFASDQEEEDDQQKLELLKQIEQQYVPSIKKWLKDYYIFQAVITCTGKGIIVDVDNHLYLANQNLISLPKAFRFGIIKGNCYLTNNRFTSFKNFPKEINGDLICNFNYITDFSGDLPIVHGQVFAEKQRVKTKYKLSDENYRKALANELNETNLVQIISTHEYGELMGINEAKNLADIKIDDENGTYIKSVQINDVDVINGLNYLE